MIRYRWRVVAGLAVTAAFAAAGAFSARTSSLPAGESVHEELIRGAHWGDSLEQALSRLPPDSISSGAATIALYFERQRIGLGSPFRLIDQALRDPHVDTSARRNLAFVLLERTAAGAGYRTDPRALDLVSGDGISSGAGALELRRLGEEHLALIQSTVEREHDPRIGELTIRLAYRLASAAGAVVPRATELAASAASQARDRVLAMRDASSLIDAASRRVRDPLELLTTWRVEHRFLVEEPVLEPLSSRAERAAVEELPTVVARIEALSGVAGEPGTANGASTETTPALLPAPPIGLGEAISRRMTMVAQEHRSPPQAPVTVTITSYAPLVQHGGASTFEKALRQHFVQIARDEETLAAEYALLRGRLANGESEVAAAVLTASVALRPYAQERAWSSEDEPPSVHDLQTRYGVFISYDREVPERWRGYLQRALSSALDDFTHIFPGYDPRGLRVRFGDSPLHERALALHDPVTRTIYFPVGSSAGVMAHEFAHDLDWQAARRYYGSAVGYRTDRAVRQVTDQLASALRQMAGALRPDTGRGHFDPQSRPTEVFARNVDWFVSAALAHDGRLNGYLSAVQDPLLTGYGSAMSPEVSRDGASATLRALDGMTAVPGELRSWFSAQYGLNRKIPVHEAVRRVLETPVSAVELREPSRVAFSSSEAVTALLRSDLRTSGAWVCLLDAFAEGSAGARGARAVMQYAAEARARGVLRRWRAFMQRYTLAAGSVLRPLDGPPWNPALEEAMVRDVRDAILWRTVAGAMRGGPAGAPFSAAASDLCR